MILKIEIENFYSIKDKVTIDFVAADINTKLAKELKDNVIEWNGTKILKSIGIFGPNASGKSNIIKAIAFCCRMILSSTLNNEGSIFNFKPFKFDNYDKKPSKFYIDFIVDNIEYEYSFTLTTTEILTEELYYYPKGRKAKIFVRNEKNDKKYSFGDKIIQKPSEITMNTSRKTLFLTRASSMNRPIAQKIYRFFLQDFLLGLEWGNTKIIEQNFNKYKSVILKALSVSDSDICDIKLIHDKLNMPIADNNIFNNANDRIIFITYHKKEPAKEFNLFVEESDGTKKLFLILLSLLDVVKYNKSLMLDEFDESLHIRLADFIIDLVHAAGHAQLLFTSHSTQLIDTHRLRRDQILFANKKENASTEIYSLYDFKDFKDNMNAEKAYLQGRFDAIPYIESSVSNLKNLLS